MGWWFCLKCKNKNSLCQRVCSCCDQTFSENEKQSRKEEEIRREKDRITKLEKKKQKLLKLYKNLAAQN